MRAQVAELAALWSAALQAADDPRERAASLGQVLFGQAGFRAVPQLDTLETLHLDSVLAQRAGYCLSLSVLALAMAEQLHLPLVGVAAPAHAFVRWQEGDAAFDIELTRGGELADPAAWRERLGDTWHDGSFYLRPLGTDEVLGMLRHNRGFVDLVQHRTRAAQGELEEVARRLPELPDVHRTLGILHGEARRWEQARACFDRALALYPGDTDALLNLALCERAEGRQEQARSDLATLLLIDPDHVRARELLAEWAAPARNGGHPLEAPPPDLRPGLLGRYHRGEACEHLLVERVDADLDFDWRRGPPAAGVPDDRFSVRWSGWFMAPRDGRYTFFVVANDGVRIDVGGQRAVDHWEAGGSSSWTGRGEVSLSAGYHALQVDYFDRSDNARLVVLVGLDGLEYPLTLAQHLFHATPR